MENIFADLGAAFWQIFRPVLSALSPLVIGLLLAYLLHPAVDWLRPKLGTGLSLLCTYITLFSALTALAGGFVVLIVGSLPTGGLEATVGAVTDYFEEAGNALLSFFAKYLPSSTVNPSSLLTSLQSWIDAKLSFQSVASAVSSLSGAAVSLFLGIIASVYLLKDQEYFLLLWHRFLSLVLKQKTHGIISEIMDEVNQVLSAFLKGAFIDGLIVAFLSSVVLSVLKVDFAVILGILSGVLNIIPYFGPFIGMIPAFLAAFFGGGLPKAAAAVAALFIVQQLDSDFIYPHIVGNSTGLHPLFVLLSVSVSGYLFGLIGMLLAVPAAGIIQVLVKRWAYR